MKASYLFVLLNFLAMSLANANPINAVLRLKSRVTMAELVKQVSEPDSKRYRKFFSPEEIRMLAAPNEASYQAQLEQIRKAGFEILGESKTHLWVIISGGKEPFERIFNLKINELRSGQIQLSKKVLAPFEWQLVVGVTGIDNSIKRFANHKVDFKKRLDGPSDGVTPDQIKSFYGFKDIYAAGLSGQGQHIAIATYNDTILADINNYYTQIGLNPIPPVDQIKFNGNPPFSDEFNLETTMDAELSGMIAPGANIHIFTSAENSDAAEAQMFTTILDDNRSHVVNYSWSSCEKLLSAGHLQEMNEIFLRGIAQGVNFMIASGDTGAAACQGDQSLQPAWPTSNPNVVSVGGTTLTIGDSTSETAWGPCGAFDGCSGGGVSSLYALPEYQKNFVAPFLRRSYPDVAFNADVSHSPEFILVSYDGRVDWHAAGGTSIGAPQWSGFMALVEEARLKKSKPPLGFLNPILYSMTSEQRASALNDITTGTIGVYQAGPGWDAVTGWGSPKAAALLNYLVEN